MKKIAIVLALIITGCDLTYNTYHEEYRINIEFNDSTCLSMTYRSEYQLAREFTIDLGDVADTIADYCESGVTHFGVVATAEKEEVWHFTVIEIQPTPFNF